MTPGRLTIHHDTVDAIKATHYGDTWSATVRDVDGNLLTLDEATVNLMGEAIRRARAPRLTTAPAVERALADQAGAIRSELLPLLVLIAGELGLALVAGRGLARGAFGLFDAVVIFLAIPVLAFVGWLFYLLVTARVHRDLDPDGYPPSGEPAPRPAPPEPVRPTPVEALNAAAFYLRAGRDLLAEEPGAREAHHEVTRALRRVEQLRRERAA